MPTRLIPLEDVARAPAPGAMLPTSIAFSPDGRLITYLLAPAGSLVRKLFAFDILTKKTELMLAPPDGGATEVKLTLEEKLRRERQRQLDLGVTSYRWAPQGTRVLLPMRDGLYMLDEPGATLRLLVDNQQGTIIDPQFSPNGKWVAYVQNGEICVVSAEGGSVQKLTQGAEEGLTHGLAEYIAQEEMGRSTGFWWSPDSRSIAFEEVDEREIPVYRIVHQGQNRVGAEAQEDHYYPFAGKANARIRLGVVKLAGGEPVWADLGDEPDIYLARVTWQPDLMLMAQVENRAQTRLDLIRFNPQTGHGQLLFSEINPIWVNLNDLFRPIRSGPYAGGFLYGSERSGYRHLYLFNAEGLMVRALTSGEWVVDALVGIDEESGLVYFTGSKATPLEMHLFEVSLEGGAERQVTHKAGMHTIIMDAKCKRFVDVYDSLIQAPVVSLCCTDDAATIAEIFVPDDARIEELSLDPPSVHQLTGPGGQPLYLAYYRPPAEYGDGPYPTIVYVYGGPHVQLVANAWRMTVNMRAQALSRQGYLVSVVDNRGSARRGLAFEGEIRHHMGTVEVDDQVAGVRWLVGQGLADPARVGVYGWSYGGYMSLMCLMRAPEVFRCAVAGAPVTHWDGYDTHYTERYMGKPAENLQGYDDSSVMAHVQSMTGRLLLVHGLIDENVHFRHTARLINALIQARKDYELMVFPDERHLPRRIEDRVYMEQKICAFFERELGKAEPLAENDDNLEGHEPQV